MSRSAKDHRIKVTYQKQQYAVDLRLLSAEFFIMADAAMLPLDLGMPRSDAKMVPPPFSAIPGFPAVIHTLPRDLRVKYDKNSTRIASAPHDMSTAVTPLDTKLRVLPTPGMALVGGVGVDCWVVRDAILAVLKGITGVLK